MNKRIPMDLINAMIAASALCGISHSMTGRVNRQEFELFASIVMMVSDGLTDEQAMDVAQWNAHAAREFADETASRLGLVQALN